MRYKVALQKLPNLQGPTNSFIFVFLAFYLMGFFSAFMRQRHDEVIGVLEFVLKTQQANKENDPINTNPSLLDK